MIRYNQPHPDEQMTMDTSRGLSTITHNRQGLPTRVTFSNDSKVSFRWNICRIISEVGDVGSGRFISN